MAPTTLTTRPFVPYDRARLDDLIFRSAHLHTHLDWHDLDDWITTQEPILHLAWRGDQLAGALAASQPLGGTTWLRAIILDDQTPHEEALLALWRGLAVDLDMHGVRRVSALVTRGWLEPIIEQMGFRYAEDIITLARTGPPPPATAPSPALIRPARLDDLPAILRIDHTAFEAAWWLTEAELRQAYHVSAAVTVAVTEEVGVAGYEISTTYRDGGHLARLAVNPAQQRTGLGAALLDDLIRRFLRRGIYQITVNTQASNYRAQALYQAFGFRRNGHDLPVWFIDLAADATAAR